MGKTTTVTYYERIKCFSYYRNGKQIPVKDGIELIMIGFTDVGIKCISEDTFQIGDVAILNIHIDKFPYEKLMCNCMTVETYGEMKEIVMEIMGMPNSLSDKIREFASNSKDDRLNLNESEKKTLRKVFKHLMD
ncbi:MULTISPECIES: hypothetical protein [unclassified Fusibacter]|uniref:hypothetical protein n=1 Tax=unclassified Fusibacter TaxID=2624464 RepID=UPI001010BCB8|nr:MULTISPECIES: hypothetical protein [unclassified Fusibacter]MCK8058252.1 hypothetical protein [Fusibacter sp. A2]NPE20835.1 hypothetical protein [Fusibacter sp. A1]RXV63040.1 hypothetical protein DWB64_03305 [Fusibacter sp. A1]